MIALAEETGQNFVKNLVEQMGFSEGLSIAIYSRIKKRQGKSLILTV